jgi:hypothetical protein
MIHKALTTNDHEFLLMFLTSFGGTKSTSAALVSFCLFAPRIRDIRVTCDAEASRLAVALREGWLA